MSESPIVSVFISSYNHARYLPQAIDSVLSQSFQDFELLILDDGSTDNSHEVLSDYQQRYPDRIHYFWHEGHANRGISHSCNVALGRARGTYFAWLGSDDYWLPEKLAIQVKFMAEHSAVGLSYTSAHTLSATGELFSVLGAEGYVSTDAWRQFVIANPIVASTAMVARHCFDVVGTFDENLVFSDWELWIRLVAKYAVAFLPEPLAVYRVHGQNISISPQKAAAILEHNLAVVETTAAHFPQMADTLKRKALAQAHVRAGLDFFAGGRSTEGRSHLQKAAELLETALPCTSESDLIEAVVAYAIHMLQASGSDTRQSARFVQNVFTSIAPNLRRRATAQFYAISAFIGHAQGHSSEVRHFVARAIILDRRWARNRGVISIAATTFLGPRISSGLRHFARASAKSELRRPTSIEVTLPPTPN